MEFCRQAVDEPQMSWWPVKTDAVLAGAGDLRVGGVFGMMFLLGIQHLAREIHGANQLGERNRDRDDLLRGDPQEADRMTIPCARLGPPSVEWRSRRATPRG